MYAGKRVRVSFDAESARNNHIKVVKDGVAVLVSLPDNALVEVLEPELCGHLEDVTGIACERDLGHDRPHRGVTTEDQAKSVGYLLRVEWPAPMSVTAEDIAEWHDRDGGQELRVFRSGGPPPPPDVTKVRLVGGDHHGWTHLERDRSLWRWSNDTQVAAGAQRWPATTVPLEFREVRS